MALGSGARILVDGRGAGLVDVEGTAVGCHGGECMETTVEFGKERERGDRGDD